MASASAILSLALAIGACTSGFRLIDALLLRPLPVAHPERLYVLGREGIDPTGRFRSSESNEYPLFRRMRQAVKDQAELVAVSYADRTDLTYGSDQEMEKANRQYVSGWMFETFGLRPALGRLFTENDDLKPRAHPQVVLSHDYWTRRFNKESNVIGRTVRIGNELYEIIGVAPARFLGTEPGIGVDIFLTTMMQPSVERSDASWFRTLVQLNPGIDPEPVRERLRAPFQAFQQERASGWSAQTKQFIDRFLDQKLVLEPAAGGRSEIQKNYRVPLVALGVLVALVLLIACVNIANLITAQAAARVREMALRISIGAGRWRLVQLVLVESGLIAILGAAIGSVFAWWSAPFVVGMINPPDNPARLDLTADWRVLGFGVALAFGVTLLFGLAPALRASGVKPVQALKGGGGPHSRHRLMHSLIAAQVAFCVLVLFVAGLFVASFDRLSHQPTGFSSDRLLTLDTVTPRAQPVAVWDQVAERLRAVPGVERVALSGWALLDGNGWNGFIWVNGAPTEVLAYFLDVSPGWTDAMRIPFVQGRDFSPGEVSPNIAIVNEAFATQCFKGDNPIGKSFEKETGDGVTRARFEVVGLVRDARYRNMREAITPTAYVPFQPKDRGTFIVRTSSANPLALAARLRQEVPAARSEFRVNNLRTQTELVERHRLRERLLAMLALFFAAVALLLAGIGLYGMLDYSVLQQRREIGIRMALGARAVDVARRVAVSVFSMVLVGALVGLGLGLASGRYIESLLYQVEATDLEMVVLPTLLLVIVGVAAALRPVIRAVRIDPVAMLRSE